MESYRIRAATLTVRPRPYRIVKFGPKPKQMKKFLEAKRTVECSDCCGSGTVFVEIGGAYGEIPCPRKCWIKKQPANASSGNRGRNERRLQKQIMV